MILVGCGDSSSDGRELTRHPGYEYMPNMYRSPSLETYGTNNVFQDSINARKPVKGTISRGYLKTFNYGPSLEDYIAAGNEAINPLENNIDNLSEGQALYGIFCTHCHGPDGAGGAGVVAGLPCCWHYCSGVSDTVLYRCEGTVNKVTSTVQVTFPGECSTVFNSL